MDYSKFFKIFICLFISGSTLPLTEEPLPIPKKITSFKIKEDHSGSYKDPGSLSFFFKVIDEKETLYSTVKSSNLKIFIGSKQVRYFLLTPSIEGYTVYIPRLPLQPKNGLYDLTVKISGKDFRVEERFASSVRYFDNTIDLILIIDTSTSMKLNDPLNYRRKAIENILRTGQIEGIIDRIAIVRFSSKAELLCSFTEISQYEIFSKALEKIDAYGETTIGEGLKVAFDEIKKNKKKNRIVAILLTDGENNGPWNEEHLNFKKESIPIHTIGLTASADNKFLDRISRETGGEFFLAPDSFSLLDIYNRIVQKESKKQILVEKKENLLPYQEIELNLSKENSFKRINLLLSSEYPVQIKGSEGFEVYFSSFPNRLWNGGFVLSEKKGSFLKIKNLSKRNNNINLTGFIKSDLKIKFFLEKKVFKENEAVPVSCLIFQDDQPLKDCKCTVRIKGPVEKSFNLYDDGFRNDCQANDGFYRNYIFSIPAGYYNLSWEVEGVDILSKKFKRNGDIDFIVENDTENFISLFPTGMGFKIAEKGVSHYRSFEAEQTTEKNISLLVIPLPLKVKESSGREIEIPVYSNPSYAIMESYRKKFFNLSIFFPDSVVKGEYTGTIITETEKGCTYLNYTVFFNPFKSSDPDDKK